MFIISLHVFYLTQEETAQAPSPMTLCEQCTERTGQPGSAKCGRESGIARPQLNLLFGTAQCRFLRAAHRSGDSLPFRNNRLMDYRVIGVIAVRN
jgi:hypothetical protein